ncbi:MAG TPA: SRPBCC family protein [Gallionella sp.]
MSLFNISSSAVIPAPAQQVYGIIADYRNGHPHIVPPRYFRNLVVEEGGTGAGTKIRFEMVLLGMAKAAQSLISEPEPGRVLAESTTDGLVVTRFIVDPLDGESARVTISSEVKSMGFAGNALFKLLFKLIYREELALLAAYARSNAGR